jgi:hypothetical protein
VNTLEVLIAHAPDEEHYARKISSYLDNHGFKSWHLGTVLVGDSIIADASRLLEQGSPVVLCGTVRAIGTGWAPRIVQAAQQRNCRIYPLQIEKDAYLNGLTLESKILPFWQDEEGTLAQLVAALQVHHPGRRSSFKLIQTILGETTLPDAQRFFLGFEASWATIRDGIPVQRTCYINDNRQLILKEAAELKVKTGLRAFVIIGPRGVGKLTLAKQIAVELASDEHKVVWLDAYPRRLCGELVPEFQLLMSKKQRIHLFAGLSMKKPRIHLTSGNDPMLGDFSDFISQLGQQPPLSLYLTVDSNHYEMFRDDLEDILGIEPQVITVPLNLDDMELRSLIRNLRHSEALGRLSGRSDEEIRQVFQKRANKILLVALIEAINGMDEKDHFDNIIRREYEVLPPIVQLAYPLVAVSDANNVSTPYSLLSSSLAKLSKGAIGLSLEQFRTGLRGVLVLHNDRVTTRHSLIASALCRALTDTEQVPNSSYGMFWEPIIIALLMSINEMDKSHALYLQEFTAAKGLSILQEELDDLAQQLVDGKFANLSAQSLSLLLNSVARIHQGHDDFLKAISWATESRKIWPSQANNADVILAYIFLAIRSSKEAIEIAKELTNQTGNPWKLFHAIRILCKAGEAKKARLILETQEDKISDLPSIGRLHEDVLKANVGHGDFPKDGNPWNHANWVQSRLDLGQIEPEEAITRLRAILDQQPNINRAFSACCHLLMIEKRYNETIALCDIVFTNASSKIETTQNLNPSISRAMALGTKGWAIFRRDGFTTVQTVEDLFQQSLKLYPKNAWCHNWRGLFLHSVEKGSGIAEQELREALRCNRNVPPFYRNLARVILETNTAPFSKERNREVITLCESGLTLCPRDSYWNWDGLRGELEALKYRAESLRMQHLPDSMMLEGQLALEPEELEFGLE